MIGIVLASHGDMAKGVLQAVGMLAGEHDAIEAIGLYPGQSPDSFRQEMVDAIERVDCGDGVLVAVDLFGGTPSNCLCQLLEDDRVFGVAGLSLPMALQAVFERTDLGAAELAASVLDAGGVGLVNIRERLSAVADDEDDDF